MAIGAEPTFSPDAKEGAPRTVSDLGLQLVWIRPGEFQMGRASGADDDERPVTQVRLTAGFWMGRTEVTQRQWTAVMGSNPSYRKNDDLPVETVSWTDAVEFCRKLTDRERAAGRLPEGFAYTLPTEAQWEFACRAGTPGDFAGGPLDMLGWYGVNSGGQTRAPGLKRANPWGLVDMHGNVWEWCLDRYGNYPGGTVTDPSGAAAGPYRVYRGGSWRGFEAYARSANRSGNPPAYRANDVGFRVVLARAI